MIVGYARVSTQDQHPELQIDALNAAGCERIYKERASGALRRRPVLDRALEDLRRGDVLVVWALDRLGRGLRDLLEIAEGLKERGVELRSLREGIDTTTAAGQLAYHLFGALAEFERSRGVERSRAAVEAARRRGKPWGRKSPFRDPETVAAAKALLRDETLTKPEIARQIGCSTSTLYEWFPGGDPDRFKGEAGK